MKRVNYNQYAIITGTSAAAFEKTLNEAMYRLREYSPRVTFSDAAPLYAYIIYSVEDVEPESLEDEYREKGFQFICAQCPYFRPVLRKDGEVDPRFKSGTCIIGDPVSVRKRGPACDAFHVVLREGKGRFII